MKREAWGHPKHKLVGRDLKLSDFAVYGLICALVAVTGKHFPQGDIGRWSNEEIAASIDYPDDADALVAVLVRRKVFDEDATCRLYLHDWHEHADDHIHMQLARRGLRFANGAMPVLSRLSKEQRERALQKYEGVQECAHTERTAGAHDAHIRALPVPVPVIKNGKKLQAGTQEERSIPSTDLAKADVSPLWLEWLSHYPKRNGDRKCASGETKFKALLKSGVRFEDLLSGVKRYRAWCDHENVTGTNLVQQIPTWLNGKAWLEPFDIPEPEPGLKKSGTGNCYLDPSQVEIPVVLP